MKKYKALIVDDEKLARKDLSAMLGGFEEIEVIGEASSVEEAEAILKKDEIDVVFLDIQMPGKSGFDLLQSIDKETKVIFVTAYDEYAVKAFEINANDYLLKPVMQNRLELTIKRLEENSVPNPYSNKKFSVEDVVFLMINTSFQFVKISTIKKITSAGNYTELKCTNDMKGLVLKGLKEWEERLPANQFVRVHKNTIINMNFVERVEEWFNSAFHIYIQGEKEPVVMSRRYAARLKERMK